VEDRAFNDLRYTINSGELHKLGWREEVRSPVFDPEWSQALTADAGSLARCRCRGRRACAGRWSGTGSTRTATATSRPPSWPTPAPAHPPRIERMARQEWQRNRLAGWHGGGPRSRPLETSSLGEGCSLYSPPGSGEGIIVRDVTNGQAVVHQNVYVCFVCLAVSAKHMCSSLALLALACHEATWL
jgi:hypothetical protein